MQGWWSVALCAMTVVLVPVPVPVLVPVLVLVLALEHWQANAVP